MAHISPQAVHVDAFPHDYPRLYTGRNEAALGAAVWWMIGRPVGEGEQNGPEFRRTVLCSIARLSQLGNSQFPTVAEVASAAGRKTETETETAVKP